MFVIDQRRLAHIFVIICLKTVDEFVITIRNMIVGRAPLIGVTAAYGVAVAVTEDSSDLNIASASIKLKGAHPTAVNLSWKFDRVVEAIDSLSLAERARVAMNLA